jgi:hypothetical protein
MHIHANYVSTSVFGDGDYYQATFEAEQDTDDADSPYLLIQRQFEDPDDNWCYIETHDEKYCGHFLLRRVDFAPQKLSIELDRPRDNLISVTFAMAATASPKSANGTKRNCRGAHGISGAEGRPVAPSTWRQPPLTRFGHFD